MKHLLRILLVLGGAPSALLAALPQYTVTKLDDFFPVLGAPYGSQGVGTFVLGVSTGGNNYLAAYSDFAHPVTPPGHPFITGAITHYVLDPVTLAPVLVVGPPAGYVTLIWRFRLR